LEIIDFHTHPFLTERYNICSHTAHCKMSADKTKDTMQKLGVSKICGSVISFAEDGLSEWDRVKDWNDQALLLREYYGDFYVPGFHVHPDYVRESCEEIDRMASLGVRLIGELIPYRFSYRNYSTKAMKEILTYAAKKGMIVSFHSMDDDDMDAFVRENPEAKLVAAHPGEYGEFVRHMRRMKMSENYFLDLSGYGIFRHGMLRHAIDEVGAERLLYGSDFPTCNPSMYLGGVIMDELITKEEQERILSKNAKRLLGI